MAALVLAVSVLCGTVAGRYQNVQAGDFSAGALQYGSDLSFLESLFMGAGAGALGLDMIFKTQNDIKNFKEGNWNWGDILDSPASQGQIDSANETIERLYNNAVKDWYDKHGGSSKPTPTPAPGVTPPVTVAPINPDDVEMPEDWGTMKKNAQDKGILAMGAATAYCVKEAVKGWWDDIMDNTPPTTDLKGNKLSSEKLIGKICRHIIYDPSGRNSDLGNSNDVFYLYQCSVDVPFITLHSARDDKGQYISAFSSPSVNVYYLRNALNGLFDRNSFTQYNLYTDASKLADILSASYSFDIYVPYSLDGVNHGADSKPLDKSSMWPSTDLKDDYDNNRSPNLPELVTPTLRLPTLDEIKDLWKQGTDDEENRPTYVTNFIINHTVQPTPDPEPTQKPDAKPTPTIAVVPDPGGDTNPKPSGSPDPDNPAPETPTPEEEASPYKADLKDIFPFCIPFDLIHLLKVFDAEPEAPVFKFPLDLELDNPWTDEKVVDYHHEFEFDFSDYEDLIKLLRIIQIVAFITGLMMITRQQMIKG